MEFNRNNYEIFMLDYIEGNLPLDMREDFMYFLNNNPDLKEEANDLMESNLIAEPILFHAKDLLKKNANFNMEGISLFEQLSIAKIEKDIDLNGIKQLDELLANSSDKRKEFQLFEKSKLTPDYSITFPNKKDIKRGFTIFAANRFYYMASAAAIIILLIGFGIFYQPKNSSYQGKAISSVQIGNPIIRQSHQIENPIYENDNNLIAKNIQPTFDTSTRESLSINQVSRKGIVAIENSKPNNRNLNLEDLAFYSPAPISESNDDFLSVKGYLNKQIKEKILKQPANEKTTMAVVGKAFGRVLSKVFKKEISVDKKVMEDGSTLYAFKAGSFEIYTNIKSSKKEENLPNKENNKKSELRKE